DRVLSVDGESTPDWNELKKAISKHPGEKIDVAVERDGKTVHLGITPGPKGDKFEGKILITPFRKDGVPVTLGEATQLAVTEPGLVVCESLRGLIRMAMLKEKAELSGPVGIVREVASVARLGAGKLLRFLGALSAYLALFNLLPIPALDGGRLMFLGFE